MSAAASSRGRITELAARLFLGEEHFAKSFSPSPNHPFLKKLYGNITYANALMIQDAECACMTDREDSRQIAALTKSRKLGFFDGPAKKRGNVTDDAAGDC